MGPVTPEVRMGWASGSTQGRELRQEQRCTPLQLVLGPGWSAEGFERTGPGLLRLRTQRPHHRQPELLQVWFSVNTGASPLHVLSSGGAVTCGVASSLPGDQY